MSITVIPSKRSRMWLLILFKYFAEVVWHTGRNKFSAFFFPFLFFFFVKIKIQKNSTFLYHFIQEFQRVEPYSWSSLRRIFRYLWLSVLVDPSDGSLSCLMPCPACLMTCPACLVCFCRDGVCPGPHAGWVPLTRPFPWALQHVQAVHASQAHAPRPKTLLQGQSTRHGPLPQL